MIFNDIKSNDLCSICFEPLNEPGGGTAVAHGGEGSKHPVHKTCIKTWLTYEQICPTCKISVNGDALFTLKDRVISYLNKDAYEISAIAITMAVSMAAGLVLVEHVNLTDLIDSIKKTTVEENDERLEVNTKTTITFMIAHVSLLILTVTRRGIVEPGIRGFFQRRQVAQLHAE